MEIANTFLLVSMRGWHRLTRSTPELWSKLSFTPVKPTKGEYFPQLRNWSQLAGSLPLTTTVFDHRGSGGLISQDRCEAVIDGFIPDVSFFYFYIFMIFFAISAAHLPVASATFGS